MGWALGKKNSIQTRTSLNYSRDGSNHLSQTLNMTDGSTFLSDIRKKGQTDHYMATVGVGYKHNFEKKGREIDCNLDGSFSKDDGVHHRTDLEDFSVTLPKTASTLKLMLLYSQTQNATAYDKTYFKEDTYLPEYDYTAPTGSQLARPVNIRGYRSSYSFDGHRRACLYLVQLSYSTLLRTIVWWSFASGLSMACLSTSLLSENSVTVHGPALNGRA